jgi:DNA uptake protein ComE-like DNA-binding protein
MKQASEVRAMALSRRTLIGAALALMALAPVAGLAADRLNPNTASAKQLTSVPGLTAPLIDAIYRGRPFKTMVEFNATVRQVLSAEDAAKVYVNLFIPINLNSASKDEIALIPGMSSRMVREFLEYRPYTGMDEFNKEIGKYVDANEVARLRSYVTL